MGTSQTCKGPSSKSPLEPEWLSSDIILNPDLNGNIGDILYPIKNTDTNLNQLMNPEMSSIPNRFRTARKELTTYLRTGNENNFKKSIASYVRKSGGVNSVISHHKTAIKVGAGIFARVATSAREIRDAIARGESAKDVLHQFIKDFGLKRGLLDSETIIQILDEVIDTFEIEFEEINDDGSNMPWTDLLVDFCSRVITYDYFQKVNFFERGEFEQRNLKEREIKALINIYVRDKLGYIEPANMTNASLEIILNRCITETYSQICEEVEFDD